MPTIGLAQERTFEQDPKFAIRLLREGVIRELGMGGSELGEEGDAGNDGRAGVGYRWEGRGEKEERGGDGGCEYFISEYGMSYVGSCGNGMAGVDASASEERERRWEESGGGGGGREERDRWWWDRSRLRR